MVSWYIKKVRIAKGIAKFSLVRFLTTFIANSMYTAVSRQIFLAHVLNFPYSASPRQDKLTTSAFKRFTFLFIILELKHCFHTYFVFLNILHNRFFVIENNELVVSKLALLRLKFHFLACRLVKRDHCNTNNFKNGTNTIFLQFEKVWTHVWVIRTQSKFWLEAYHDLTITIKNWKNLIENQYFLVNFIRYI